MLNFIKSAIRNSVIVGVCFSYNQALGFGLKDVYKNLHTNTTSPGNYQDAAAGYYSGGGAAIRTKNTAIQPFSVTAPSLNTGCNGIDAHLGSFSMISGGELISIAKNIGSQAIVYGFHLGMKTYAPQIEQVLTNLRNLQMELNQFGIGHCKVVQAGFAAALPQNSAMYEKVCEEMASGGGADLGGQRKKCKDNKAVKAAVDKKQERDPEALIDNYNIFIKAARAAGIPKELHPALMSMLGTVVVKNGVVIPYPSLANNPESWNIHINGGTGASMYSCDNENCLNININNNVAISKENSYAGKAKLELSKIKSKMIEQTSEFTEQEKGFLDSIGQAFPIFDHITLEAVSNISILDASGQLVARYMLMTHLNKVTADIKKGVYYLKNKQLNEVTLNDYEKNLNKLSYFANTEWVNVMSDADRVNARAEKIWKHLMARERG